MRPAVYVAGTMIALGLYVAVAAVLALTPSAIGLGILGISSLAAIALVAGSRQLPTR